MRARPAPCSPRDLARVRQLAASLDRLQPPPATWTRIAREAQLPGFRTERSRRGWQGWIPLAAAAVIVLAGAVTWMVEGAPNGAAADGQPVRAPTDRRSGTADSRERAAAGRTALRESHRGARAARQRPQGARSASWPESCRRTSRSSTVRSRESRAALKADPASEPAQQSLFEAFRTKIALLQDTVALINEMRKGNPEGTARVAEGMHEVIATAGAHARRNRMTPAPDEHRTRTRNRIRLAKTKPGRLYVTDTLAHHARHTHGLSRRHGVVCQPARSLGSRRRSGLVRALRRRARRARTVRQLVEGLQGRPRRVARRLERRRHD